MRPMQPVAAVDSSGTEDQATILRKLQHVKDLLKKEEKQVQSLATFLGVGNSFQR